MQIQKQDNNLLNCLGDYTDREVWEAIYQLDLPTLIDREIYRQYPKAKDGNWKLGKLHNEWNELLAGYDLLDIKAPRDHLKTFFFFEARALQLCRFKGDIEIKYVAGSDSLGIAKLDNVKKSAKLPFFRKLLRNADTNNKMELRFGNGSKISIQGFWSKLRGGHPDYLILDDIIDSSVVYSDDANKKARERVATEILPMASPHTQIIIIGTMQREDDIYSIDWGSVLSGFGNRRAISKTYDAIVDEDKHLTLFPEKWSWPALMAKREEIIQLSGEKWFLKEYRNFPVNLVGEIIKPEWKRTYTELPKKLKIYTGWDLSVGKDPSKGDYAAKVTFGVDDKPWPNIYIIHVYRGRIDFGKRIKKVIGFGKEESPIRISIEDNVFQADTVQVAKKNSSLPIVGVTTTKNKIEKYNEMLVPLSENGRIFLKAGDKMQEEFWKELCSLPGGAFDDMADGFCVGLRDLPLFNRADDYLII